ncbi:MAG: hypothetical protein AAGB22_03800 [Bacteroidota bacterium]
MMTSLESDSPAASSGGESQSSQEDPPLPGDAFIQLNAWALTGLTVVLLALLVGVNELVML